ncbi:carbohydrate ABC transporter permease [Rugosimonospora acidiphila]|uniref:Carbohydrate ABC transporter permease n=1 Tax=Rugosimonospora acidiphila TaxID=556531 RepID=A0ABP9S2U0_9ACTN
MSTTTTPPETRGRYVAPAKAPAAARRNRPGRVTPAGVVQYALLIALAVASFFLIFVMVDLSLRRGSDIYVNFWHLFSAPDFGNYRTAVVKLLPALGRTLFIAVASIAGILLASTASAYAFARLRFPGRDVLYYLVLAVMTVPTVILLTPQFVLANQLHLVGSVWGLIVFYIAAGLPFAVFLVTTFFRSQPDEVFQAARMDGASEVQSLLRVAVPLATPILVTVAMMNFLTVYGDYIWPTLILNSGNDTLLMALQTFSPRLDAYVNRPDFGVQSAGYAFATIPQLIVFILGMRYFVAGVTSGAVKA